MDDKIFFLIFIAICQLAFLYSAFIIGKIQGRIDVLLEVQHIIERHKKEIENNINEFEKKETKK